MAVGETGNGTVYKGSIERVNIMKTVNVVAAIICNGSKYFATQRGYGEFKDWWEFPGGKIEPNETPEEALHREIKEELDIEITIDTHLVTVDYDYPKFHLHMYCYLCHVSSGEPTLIEAESARWLSKEELSSVNWLPADILVVKKLVGGTVRQ